MEPQSAAPPPSPMPSPPAPSVSVPSVPVPRRSRSAGFGLAAVLVLAGLLFTISAQSSRGIPLRAERSDASGVVKAEESTRDQRAAQVAALTREVEARTAAEARVHTGVAALQHEIAQLGPVVGKVAVRGPGVVVQLDDAPRGTPLQPGITPDDLVVHQQDVQAVVNALWRGGAEAMSLMDQRVIGTSAVRCVGNTLLLQGRVYSPPYRIAAIGDPARLQRALAESTEVSIYREYVSQLHLGFDLSTPPALTVPAFDGPIDLRYAHLPTVPGSPAAGGTAPGGSLAPGTASGSAPAPGTASGSASRSGDGVRVWAAGGRASGGRAAVTR